MDVYEVHADSADQLLNHQHQKSYLVIGPPRFRLWFVGDSANDETVKGQEAYLPCRESVCVRHHDNQNMCPSWKVRMYPSRILLFYIEFELLLKFQVQSIFVGTSLKLTREYMGPFFPILEVLTPSTITLSGSRKASTRTSSEPLHSLTWICCTHRKPIPNVAGVPWSSQFRVLPSELW